MIGTMIPQLNIPKVHEAPRRETEYEYFMRVAHARRRDDRRERRQRMLDRLTGRRSARRRG
jgi:hypothetical protein